MVAAVPVLVTPFASGLSLTFTLGLVVLLALTVVVALLLDIRTNTRRTAEAVERLADQRENDESDP
jgi:CHASE3 domain sensor protein